MGRKRRRTLGGAGLHVGLWGVEFHPVASALGRLARRKRRKKW